MSGGGGNSNETTAPTTGPVQYQTLPASMPGQLGLIGNQLAAGFGGDPAQYTGLLNTLHSPMVIPQWTGAQSMANLYASIPEELRIKKGKKDGKTSDGFSIEPRMIREG
jgi:hypothetical protein